MRFMQATARCPKVNTVHRSALRCPIPDVRTIGLMQINARNAQIPGKKESMPQTRVLLCAGLIVVIVAGLPLSSHAQDLGSGSRYGGGAADSPYPPPQATAPMTSPDEENGNSFTIPIPEGGEITVDGPDAPVPNPLPKVGGSNWGIERQTPNLPGSGPIGPQGHLPAGP